MGLPVAIFGTITPGSFQMVDLFMLVFSSILLFVLTRRDHKITRLDGILMLGVFILYYGYIVYGALA